MRQSSVSSTNSRLSVISQNSGVGSSNGGGEYSGFVVDVVAQLAREVASLQFEWLVDDTRRHRDETARRRSADSAPVRRVLAAVRTHPFSALRGCQTIDKVGQLLWAWFSCRRKSVDEVVEP